MAAAKQRIGKERMNEEKRKENENVCPNPFLSLETVRH